MNLLLSELQTQMEDPTAAASSVAKVATQTSDADIRTLFQLEAAQIAENANDAQHAYGHFVSALANRPSLTAASLGVARTSRALGRNTEAVNTLMNAAEVSVSDGHQELLLTTAGRWRDVLLDDSASAFDILSDVPGEMSARVAAQIARRLGDKTRLSHALSSIAAQCTGRPRALALLELSDLARHHGRTGFDP